MMRPAVERADYALVVLNAATTARGLCGSCAAHWWLYSVDGVRWALRDGGAAILQMPAVQSALNRILGMMHPELDALDWDRLLGQWRLPWPDDWRLPQ